MAYKVIILYRLYMPSYFLGTFTEYPILIIYSLLNFYPQLILIEHRLIDNTFYLINFHGTDFVS